MKNFGNAAIVILVLLSFIASTSAATEPDDPCRDEGYKKSNRETRECYSREQVRVTTETDSRANKIAYGLRQEARDFEARFPRTVVGEMLRRAASAVVRSQKTWKIYSAQHCKAVEYTWTTGSGAGTAYERCMFQLGKERLGLLQSEFH